MDWLLQQPFPFAKKLSCDCSKDTLSISPCETQSAIKFVASLNLSSNTVYVTLLSTITLCSAQINYGPIGIVYEEEKDENGMMVQKSFNPNIPYKSH